MFIQIIVTILAIMALVATFLRFRRANIGRAQFLFWLVFWVLAAVFVWNPRVTNLLANLLGVGRGADAVFYLAIIILFYAVFRLYGKLEGLEHKLSELVKKIALKDWEVEVDEDDKKARK
ncbi:MAG: DUF2304 family protein [bacterium]|nr:DUF2304 family protein [bacterium]